MTSAIVQAGSALLRRAADPLTPAQIHSDATRALVARMRELMRAAGGVGLAAPQAGVALQVVVVELTPEGLARRAAARNAALEMSEVPFQVLINPRLTVLDATPRRFFEGCLSLEGMTAITPRARSVRVESFDEAGEAVTTVAHGWFARILQHEVDHLHGTLYVDRMLPRSLMTAESYREHWAEHDADAVIAALDVDRPTRA
jgi:peptide deformylase